MFRYTPISGKTPHQQLVAYMSNRIPIISDTISHVIFRYPNSSISPKSYRYKTPIKDPQKISPQQKSIRYFHHIGFVQKKCIKPPTMKLYDDDTHDIHIPLSHYIYIYSPVSVLSRPSRIAGLSLVSSSLVVWLQTNFANQGASPSWTVALNPIWTRWFLYGLMGWVPRGFNHQFDVYVSVSMG